MNFEQKPKVAERTTSLELDVVPAFSHQLKELPPVSLETVEQHTETLERITDTIERSDCSTVSMETKTSLLLYADTLEAHMTATNTELDTLQDVRTETMSESERERHAAHIESSENLTITIKSLLLQIRTILEHINTLPLETLQQVESGISHFSQLTSALHDSINSDPDGADLTRQAILLEQLNNQLEANTNDEISTSELSSGVKLLDQHILQLEQITGNISMSILPKERRAAVGFDDKTISRKQELAELHRITPKLKENTQHAIAIEIN